MLPRSIRFVPSRVLWAFFLIAACSTSTPSSMPDDDAGANDSGARSCPTDCNDGNACTDDACGADGTCAHTNNSATCDDGDGCTVDRCEGGTCKGRAAGCSASSTCADTLLPTLPELGGGCVLSPPSYLAMIGINASCAITNGCGTRDGCPLDIGTGTTTTTYVAPSASFAHGGVRVAFTSSTYTTSFVYNNQCVFTASFAAGASAAAQVTFSFDDPLVCGQPLDPFTSTSFVVTGNVNVTAVPLGATSQATCDGYAALVDQPTRRSIASQIVAEFYGAITLTCGSCADSSCAGGLRCEP